MLSLFFVVVVDDKDDDVAAFAKLFNGFHMDGTVQPPNLVLFNGFPAQNGINLQTKCFTRVLELLIPDNRFGDLSNARFGN